MKANHEIRFPVTAEEIELIYKFKDATLPDVKKTGFHRRTYLLGLQAIKQQALKTNRENTLKKILE